MKIVHNIALSVGELEQAAFAEVGVPLKRGFTSFLIEEEDLRWPGVAGLARLYQAVDTTTTKFSSQELSAAKYLGMASSWHHGYPEPSDTFGYLEKTFDQKSYCRNCGIGLVQMEPFRIKRPPTWGAKSILQLNWVFDEYFVRPDVWEEVFKPHGVGCRSVLLDSTSVPVESMVQLDISNMVELKVDDGILDDRCRACGRGKYLPISRGGCPAPVGPIDAAAFKSFQYFGSGARAYRAVMVSASLYRAIKSAGIKGVDFKPCAE